MSRPGMIVEGEAGDVNHPRGRYFGRDMRRIQWVLALILAAAVFAALTPQG